MIRAALLLALAIGLGMPMTDGVAQTRPAVSSGAPAPEAKAKPPARQSWIEAPWAAYKARFIKPDGRVVDDANGISHSEGQGYALILAVAAQDRPTFDLVWGWARRELGVREDGLLAWKWDEKAQPRVSDTNNASDGDLLIAWALVKAARLWENPVYTDEARRLLVGVTQANVARSPMGLLLMPGAVGFSREDRADGPVVNLSYWVFPALDDLRGLAPEARIGELRDTGLRLLKASAFGPTRLPSDWVALGGETPAPAQGFPPRFSYNAIRIPLYLAWAGIGDAPSLRAYAGLWNRDLDVGPFEIDVLTGAAAGPFTGAGYKAVVSLAGCALDGRRMPPALKTVSTDLYYPTTLHMLALLAMHERYPQCL